MQTARGQEGGGSMLRRSSLSATGFGEVRALVETRYDVVASFSPAAGAHEPHVSVSSVVSPELSVDTYRMTSVGGMTLGPFPGMLATMTVHSGAVAVDGGPLGHATAVAGESCLMPLDGSYAVSWYELAADIVLLPLARLLPMAEKLTGRPASEVHFTSAEPASVALAGLWRATAQMLLAQLGRPGGPAEQQPVRESLLRTAVTAALSVYPNTAVEAAGAAPGEAATTAYRRAVDWIDVHAADHVGVDEMARAAGAATHDLDAVFRVRRGVGPMTYLAQVRLDRVRAELLAAPAPGRPAELVEQVAGRWRFDDLAQFAAAYRDRFGHAPDRDALAG
ncbi:MAG: helix-turn-helix domain-containing protein [Dermatophilaceae bacterium]